MSLHPSRRGRNHALSRLGRHVRDLFIRAFPLDMRTESGLVVRVRNRSEMSVYHSIFVQRVYPLDRYRDRLGSMDSPVVFDVGANTGMFAAAIFDHWPRAQVHSFEPQSRLLSRLREAATLNGLEHCQTINGCAVAGASGEAEFFQNRNPISASLLKDKAARRRIRRVERVAVITLDEYVQRHQLERVDLLKVDVEGVEIDALRGATNVLRSVRLVFVEVHPPFSTFSQAQKLLRAEGLVCASPSPAPDDLAQANCVFIREQVGNGVGSDN